MFTVRTAAKYEGGDVFVPKPESLGVWQWLKRRVRKDGDGAQPQRLGDPVGIIAVGQLRGTGEEDGLVEECSWIGPVAMELCE